jgi:prepilin-type N-terminal cleavage/methylation domain-containing protein
MKNNDGFSLIEVLMVVAIIGILCAVAVPLYFSHIQKARVTKLIMPNLRVIEQNIALYYPTRNTLPTSLELPIIWADADTNLFNFIIDNEEFVLTIDSPDFTSELSLFHGQEIRLKPIINNGVFRSFEVTGDLAKKIGMAN